MPEWLTKLFSLSQEISSKVALPMFLATTAILFLPDEYASRIGIDELRGQYRLYIGLILVIGGTALASNLLWAIGGFIKPYLKERVWLYHRRKVLLDLTNDEKAILRCFIFDGRSEVHADISNGTINLLEGKKIVTRASSVSSLNMKWAYLIHPWARTYLKKHPELLH
ncbi:hypothetical protein ATN84_01740 [Paramesorhizobium deserti]|uniref:Superinfection exclusion protein B n=1 Tax=Paramesorhizobium deserti TaxID=1494590 RepID=A0A135HZ97_9HYPH|nr:superinfection exclusion B family protein [Paramesorhizobium deserti]KXF78540.1 hypothetical protein ATN84_01740 [Paramesorhizobium deserti]